MLRLSSKIGQGQYNVNGQSSRIIGQSSKPLRTYVLIHREKEKNNNAQPLSRIDLPNKNALQGYMFDRAPFVSKKPPQRACTLHTLAWGFPLGHFNLDRVIILESNNPN